MTAKFFSEQLRGLNVFKQPVLPVWHIKVSLHLHLASLAAHSNRQGHYTVSHQIKKVLSFYAPEAASACALQNNFITKRSYHCGQIILHVLYLSTK